MSHLDDLRDEFLTGLASVLAPHGYKLNKATYRFVKKTASGSGGVRIAFIRHPGVDFDITLYMSVRIDAVESIANEFDSELSEAEKKKSVTMAVEYGNLVGTGQYRWTIETQDDVSPAIAGVWNAAFETALPYIEKYSDMRAALGALSGFGPDYWRHRIIDGPRVMRALILAFLLQDRTEFEQIADESQRFLEERNDRSLKNFTELATRLRSQFPTN